MSKNTAPLPDWELVLSSAARLQRILPDAELVGETASAIHAGHRFSRDADHVLTDLRQRFDEVLAQFESVAGWKTARVQRPVQILGSLDGIDPRWHDWQAAKAACSHLSTVIFDRVCDMDADRSGGYGMEP
ncbi:MAG: hypothetical protein WBI41_04055 [Azovibrio sp.]|uniref:hypothetical protein n=1 Tax=Azovibrio sp. TaxID=1872673 RepID=UPI003C74171C